MKQKVGMTVEVFGVHKGLYSMGYVSPDLATHLGIAPDAGWRMTDVNVLTGPQGAGRVTVRLVREIEWTKDE